MRSHITLLLIPVLLFALANPVFAEWPSTLKENLVISREPGIWEGYVCAIPYPDSKTLVVLWKEGFGSCYQIIDRDGNYVFPELRLLDPDVPGPNSIPKLWPDGEDGALITWGASNSVPPGIYAQRLDEEGNCLWDSSGSRISFVPGDYDICTDCNGGFNMARGRDGDIWAHRTDYYGMPMWGDSGVVVCSDPYGQSYPKITYHSVGVYIVWVDHRPPYGSDGALFMQKLDLNGNSLWSPDGVFICEDTQFHQIIPDGEDGFILHTNPGGLNYNSIFRISPNGDILWTRDFVSWWFTAQIVEGDAGFFYTGYWYGDGGVYAQKMDIQGNIHWPEPGAPLAIMPQFSHGVFGDFSFRSPYLFGIYEYTPEGTYYGGRLLFVQALDSLGHRMWCDNGTLLTALPRGHTGQFINTNAVPDGEGGIVGVFEHKWRGAPFEYDIYAKHCRADGTLGGPEQLSEMSISEPKIHGIAEGYLRYEIPEHSRVNIELYNILGQHISTITEGYFSAGTQAIHVDDRGLAGGGVFHPLECGLRSGGGEEDGGGAVVSPSHK